MMITAVRELLDVLYHAVKLPLAIDLHLTTQGEAIHLFVSAYIAKHRLHRGKAARDHLASTFAVNLALHAIARFFFRAGVLTHEDGHLSALASLRVAQALGSQRTFLAIALGRTKLNGPQPLLVAVAPVAIQSLSGRTDEMTEVCSNVEIARLEQLGFCLVLGALVPQRIGLGPVLLLAFVAWVALAIVRVGNVALDAAC